MREKSENENSNQDLGGLMVGKIQKKNRKLQESGNVRSNLNRKMLKISKINQMCTEPSPSKQVVLEKSMDVSTELADAPTLAG